MTVETLIEQVAGLGQDVLTPVIRGVLGDDSASPALGWSVNPIGKSFGAGTLGIFHVSGDATSADGSKSWSVVAKVMDLDPNDSSNLNSAYNGPDAEIRAYESGLLSTIGSQISSDQTFRAARHFGTSSVDGLGTILWIEDLSAAPSPPWDDKTCAEVGRHMGHFNAYWELNKPEPQSWFMSDGFGSRTGVSLNRWSSLGDYTSDPLVKRGSPPDVLRDLSNLHGQILPVIEAINAGPRPLNHVDAQPRNLFPMPLDNGGFETVAIDWASLGYAPLGTDPAQIVGSSLTWCEVEPEHGVLLHEKVLDGFVTGLSDMGWSGNIELVRLSYMTQAMIRSANMLFHAVRWIDNPEHKPLLSRAMGRPVEAIVDQQRDTFRAVYPSFQKTLTASGM
ncbi:MAG: hypothetical protein HOL45_07775 [Chloroflexi bacterium]|nr:hypothetical protein [Chloroflexota bacterium]